MMNPTTNFFKQNWVASAGDAAAGYINNWRTFDASKIIRLLHVSLEHTGARRVRLFVTTHDGEYFRIADDDYADDQAAIWNGSLILRNVTSVGAQVLAPAAADLNRLRIIWEELQ